MHSRVFVVDSGHVTKSLVTSNVPEGERHNNKFLAVKTLHQLHPDCHTHTHTRKKKGEGRMKGQTGQREREREREREKESWTNFSNYQL